MVSSRLLYLPPDCSIVRPLNYTREFVTHSTLTSPPTYYHTATACGSIKQLKRHQNEMLVPLIGLIGQINNVSRPPSYYRPMFPFIATDFNIISLCSLLIFRVIWDCGQRTIFWMHRFISGHNNLLINSSIFLAIL